MVVTRSSMAGTKEANETMGVTRSSMTSTKKTDDMRKKGRRHAVKSKEMDAFSMFMITDFLKRYYQNHPRSTTGMIPDDAEFSGNIEWMNMSESEKASWIENVNNMKAAGKTLFQLSDLSALLRTLDESELKNWTAELTSCKAVC